MLIDKFFSFLKCMSLLEKLPRKLQATESTALALIAESENKIMAIADRLENDLQIVEQQSRDLDRQRDELFETTGDIIKACNNIFESLSLINISLETGDIANQQEYIESLQDKLRFNLEIVNKHREQLENEADSEEFER